MRLRNNPEALPMLEEHSDIVFINPKDMKGKWHEVFHNDHPLFIEIGMGKGDFILENAKRYPDVNFIGIEKYSTVLAIAVNKGLKDGVPDNLRYMKEDAVMLPEIFNKGEVETIYLNFSDPWPKKRHAKRRLTYSSFLNIYKDILPMNGHLIFKTDNRGLFEYSLCSFANHGLYFNDVCLDLHHSEGYDDNIETEYEKKFKDKGPIYRCDIIFNKENQNG